MALATEFNGTIINADAQQLYRELSILTDRPGPEQLARVPHRLFGVLSASDPCSAGRWRELALAEMNAASEAGRLPILVGGTGLYFKALLSGLSSIPPVPPEIRGEATTLYERLGHEQFQAELARLDPGMSDMPRDKQRLIRAYEVARCDRKTLAGLAATNPAMKRRRRSDLRSSSSTRRGRRSMRRSSAGSIG